MNILVIIICFLWWFFKNIISIANAVIFCHINKCLRTSKNVFSLRVAPQIISIESFLYFNDILCLLQILFCICYLFLLIVQSFICASWIYPIILLLQIQHLIIVCVWIFNINYWLIIAWVNSSYPVLSLKLHKSILRISLFLSSTRLFLEQRWVVIYYLLVYVWNSILSHDFL